ncbi:amino acid/amide ABC transporter substrate-binding protein, HAAT family [Roseovarius lutimaris]|uniref:Amino acid/amide ABC transporter substrate-binding protein, HAAT family n=1 Tax=Roseovarius lutimaris TaxID=1005928 RepID=A0A1I5GNW6_9RHOB|nr:branched-chain amino acid ABC transporter substrate-binding protein [Roseovarius lutimaris]SFO37685.1 amino acid/amide ABC transporter substrate-binding protein, HAAT family [Roseovarius lutimaris]
MTTKTTKRFGHAVLVAGAAMGCTALTAGPVAAELRIGLIETMSGPQASSGEMILNGVKFVIDKMNAEGGFHGEPITVEVYDSAGTTTGAAQQFREAVSDEIDIVIQGPSSAIAGQISDDVRKHNLRNPRQKMVFINVAAGAMELTGERCHYHSFRLYPTPSMWAGSLVEVMSREGTLGDKVYSINQDYSWGHDWQDAIVDQADNYNYEVVDKVLHDVNRIQDFSPYAVKIKAANPNTVITGNWSNDLLLLMKAAKDAGLSVRFATSNLDQPGNVANAGAAALGHYNASLGSPALGDGSFAEEYKAAYGRVPVYNDISSVVAMNFVAAALASIEGEGDPTAQQIVEAMETAMVDTGYGTQTMRAQDHQFQMPIVVSRVSKDAKYKVDGSDMGFSPVATVSAETLAYAPQESCKMTRP